MAIRNLTAGVHEIRVLSKYKPTLKRQILFSTRIKPRLSHIIYTGRSCYLLLQWWESRWERCWRVGWGTRDMWADSLCVPFSLQDFLCMCVGQILIFGADLGPHSCSLMCTPKSLLLSPTSPVCISTEWSPSALIDVSVFSFPDRYCILHTSYSWFLGITLTCSPLGTVYSWDSGL